MLKSQDYRVIIGGSSNVHTYMYMIVWVVVNNDVLFRWCPDGRYSHGEVAHYFQTLFSS